jgi:hypothetical protein
MGWIGLAVTVAAAWWLVRSLRQLEARLEDLDRSLQAVREELRNLH